MTEFERGQKNIKDVYESYARICKATKEQLKKLLNMNKDSAREAIKADYSRVHNEFFLGVICQCNEYLKKL